MAETYTLEVAGLKRELKMFEVSEHLDIAAFILFGDVELCEHCAEELLKICPEFVAARLAVPAGPHPGQ